MHPLQLVLVAAIVVFVAIYVVRGVKRGIRADEVFFAALVRELVQALEPKGFRLAGNLHHPKSFGNRLARFQGAASHVNLVLDGKERDIRLERRGDDESASTVLAQASVSHYATPADYAAASTAILEAAAAI